MQVEVFITQYQDNVASLHFSAFLDHNLLHYAPFGRANLNGGHGHDGTVDTDIVVEVGAEDLADGEGVAADALGTAVGSHDEVQDEEHYDGGSPEGEGFSGEGAAEAFLGLYGMVHFFDFIDMIEGIDFIDSL